MATANPPHAGVVRIAHVCLRTRNLDASVAFYRDALGLPVAFTFAKDGRTFGAYFAAGNQNYIEVFEQRDYTAVPGSLQHVCLEVPDLAAAVAALEARGVRCREPTLGCDRSWQTWIADPDGHPIEIHQYTPESAQRLGGVVQANG